jgi:WD40 repeat protein
VAWSPDGSRVATASADLSTCLWDARTGQRTLLLLGRQPVYNLLFTPDGRLLANEMNGKVQVWEAGE